MTHGTVAGMILTDLIIGRENSWSKLYNPGRVTLDSKPADFISYNIDPAKNLLSGVFSKLERDLEDLKNDEGKLLELEDGKVAVYKDNNGKSHILTSHCSHLRCYLVFNDGEKSWDCPCHGSRFDIDGKVLHSPAVKDLEREDPV
jgi:Rieske Fe-S protein